MIPIARTPLTSNVKIKDARNNCPTLHSSGTRPEAGEPLNFTLEVMANLRREKMHFRLPVAVGHVHAAIQIFDQPGLDASVLHLAAAADEIFEALLKREGKTTLSETLLMRLQEHMPELDRKTFHRKSTRWKNAVKHADVPAEDVITMPSTQPFFYLARAILNYDALMSELTPQMGQFMSRFNGKGEKP